MAMATATVISEMNISSAIVVKGVGAQVVCKAAPEVTP